MVVSPQQALPGQVVEFTMTIANPFGVTLSEVKVTNQLSALVEYVSSAAPKGTITHDAGTNVVTYVLDSMAPNESVVMSISGRVRAGAQAPGDVSNSAGICQAGGCCATASASALIVPAGIPVTGAGPSPVDLSRMLFGLLSGLLASLAGGWLVFQKGRR
jgi:uncharacterized repeat protein (TIGR01451 family)